MRFVGSLLLVSVLACTTGPRYDIGEIDLTALAAEQDVQMAEWRALKARLDGMFLPLIRSGVAICETGPYYGFSHLTSDVFTDGFQRRLAETRGIGTSSWVSSVAPTSPAAHAGLMPGDEMQSINGASVVSREEELRIVEARASQFRRGSGNEPITTFERAMNATPPPTRFTVWRQAGSSGAELLIEPETTCSYRAHVIEGGVNAFADGTNVYVAKGMMDFVETNAELQFVLAHELAHNGAGHVDAMRRNTIMGALVGAITDAALGLPGTMTRTYAEEGMTEYSQDFEREADYLAVYFLARAGVDLSGLEGFWRRMAEGAGYQAVCVDGAVVLRGGGYGNRRDRQHRQRKFRAGKSSRTAVPPCGSSDSCPPGATEVRLRGDDGLAPRNTG